MFHFKSVFFLSTFKGLKLQTHKSLSYCRGNNPLKVRHRICRDQQKHLKTPFQNPIDKNQHNEVLYSIYCLLMLHPDYLTIFDTLKGL